ncbi:M23 family metallopeptidase [Pleionea mediterranea]|uniref:Murein DD-endopeptidase MepM/ murein hydrolase activator NlpD n=1 Tax=Pleionea mediterranea TaxID=523701 RepID=A0A316G0Q3_9GAMM|nr:M23 family metallopeptidase [Pleionea mediterranea]PWK47927.1 murein DD-endopeptidase MepM/ murein hydrolase activator NlpD [Pleionea mediterranea]
MSFTILQRSRNGIRSLKVTKLGIMSLLTFAVTLPVITAVGGYQLAKYRGHIASVDQDTINDWRTQLADQRTELDKAKERSQKKLNALTARLGILQAHVRRLDAAGSRIANIAGIDANEFNFSQPPAIGGPEEPESVSSNSSDAEFLTLLDDLSSQLLSREQQLSAIESLVLDKHIGVESYISGRPITKGWMSSFYGRRTDPFSGRPAWHAGLDFAGKEGAPVVSTAAGVVSFVGDRHGYGLLIEISHGDGFVTRYGHNKTALVKVGEVISKNQQIAEMGNSGRSTGAHVHYEILKNGRQINPLRYVNRRSKS